MTPAALRGLHRRQAFDQARRNYGRHFDEQLHADVIDALAGLKTEQHARRIGNHFSERF